MIKQKFYHAIENASPSPRIRQKAFLFLPPWEDHDFALLYSNMILKENGYDVVNVGKTISFDSILQCIDKIKPDLLFTTYCWSKGYCIQQFCDDVNSRSNCKLFFGGNPDLLRLVNTHGKVFYSFRNLISFLPINLLIEKNCCHRFGFAGLTSAIELAALGYDVTVYEKNNQPGGRARKLEVMVYF